MNRQMRTQMPQTQKRGKNTGKKKQFDRNACLLVTVQIFARNPDFSAADCE